MAVDKQLAEIRPGLNYQGQINWLLVKPASFEGKVG